MKDRNRRSVFKRIIATITGVMGIAAAQAYVSGESLAKSKHVVGDVMYDEQEPLFSSAIIHGDLLFLAGKGAHFEGDIKDHTDHVLNELEKELKKHGSSMEKVLKVNVYLADLADYKAMNEVYRGRFGSKPPVRTTVATYGGVPGNSLVEIDCIAAV